MGLLFVFKFVVGIDLIVNLFGVLWFITLLWAVGLVVWLAGAGCAFGGVFWQWLVSVFAAADCAMFVW